MRQFAQRFLFALLLAGAVGYGVASAAGPYNCYMDACGCTWQATSCEYCNFQYSGGECIAIRTGCDAFTLNCID